MSKYLWISFILSGFFISELSAVTLKMATLAPQGTTYADTLSDMAKEIKKKTDGRVKFKIYYGGVAGDEPDALRKIFVGQLHGGIFTGKTLGDIYGDIRAMEIPFNFYQNREKALSTLKKLESYFSDGLTKKGYISLGFYEIGQVYIVSTKKVSNVNDLKGSKIWSWEGDELVKSLVSQLGLVSVPLSLPDVLSSLSTGIINSAYAPPLGIMAMQWHTKVKYLLDFPVAYSIGALLVSDKIWKKIKSEDQSLIKEITRKYIDKSSQTSVEENKQAMQVFKNAKIEFIPFAKADQLQGEEIRTKVINDLQGKLFSKEIVELINKER
jgi:TRAP-type C4-dicarboxylate transport system substrate-binding protein